MQRRLSTAGFKAGAAVLLLLLGGCGEDLNDVVTRTDCGDANQVCCDGNTCFHGAVCAPNNFCRGVGNRPTNECRSADECASNGICGGFFDCAGGRACFLCEAQRVTATVPFGGPCTTGGECLTNVCLGGRCTVPCRHGPEGDTLCRGQAGASRYEFCATIPTVPENAPMSPPTTVTVCAARCADSVPCPDGFRCLQTTDGLHDRVLGTCGIPRMQSGGP